MADDASEPQPVLRNAHHQEDKLASNALDQTNRLQGKAQAHGGPHVDGKKNSDKPAGGFDGTSIPHAPPGYTLKFTFHCARNLPFADINSLSSDPYLIATLKTDLVKRHKQDPDLRFRVPTIHRNTNPEWKSEWVVANIPASGFLMKCTLYDEDPVDHDDRLGNVHVHLGNIADNWNGIREHTYDIKKRMGSKRAYMFRGCAVLFSRHMKMSGEMVISVENLGRTKCEDGGRAYTIGPLAWSRHFSPLIGRLVGTKQTADEGNKKGDEKYNFQAVQMQLAGPVPVPLYHRYVEFKPFVAGMFTSHSLRGRILNRALHHQHARIYNYDRSTLYGLFHEPCVGMTKQFLDFVHYDQGGRIYTYILTLDAHWHFTETGKEFGIDLLSKHTMHSDVSIYIAFSGEFFIRRLKHPHKNRQGSPDPITSALPPAPEPDEQLEDQSKPAEPSKDPGMYELVIDNDSGTYRPNAKYLPALKEFMAHNLPGLRIVTLDSQADAEKMGKLKDQQRERKKASGTQMTYLQNTSESSLSSSDEEELQSRAGGGPRKTPMQRAAEDVRHHTQQAKVLVGHGHGHGLGDDGQTQDGGIVGKKAPALGNDPKEAAREEGGGPTLSEKVFNAQTQA